jgi:transporter family-2 protein
VNARTARILTVPLMVVAGAGVALQSRINGSLAGELGEGLRAAILAAVISFCSGLVLVTLVAIGTRHGRVSMRRLRDGLRGGPAARRLHWPELLGGLSGAFFVASQGIAVGVIGIALFIVAYTAGQSLSSVVVDHLGFGPAGRQHATPPRMVAAAFAVVAVLPKAFDQLQTTSTWVTVGLAVLAFVAGTGQAVQQALNGRVSAVAGPVATTWNNFLVGTLALLVVLGASFTVDGRLVGLPSDPWLYLGGAMGIVFIAIAAITVHVHGVLVLGLCMIAGQVVCAEVLELFEPAAEVGALGVAGGLVAILGVVIALALRPARPPVT